MHVAVVTPPAVVVSLADARNHLRVDHDEEDELIEAWVAAAFMLLDGPAGILNRALAPQVLQATLYGFPDGALSLPCEPITTINDVTYIAADGVETDVDPAVYELTDDGQLRLEYDQAWPTPRSDRDPVRITYTAGYTALPKPLRAAILLMVGDLYAHRETGVVGTVSAEIKMSTTVENLVAPYRNRRA